MSTSYPFLQKNCGIVYIVTTGFPVGSVVKNSPANARDAEVGSMPESRRSPGVKNGNSLQYSCLQNSKNKGVEQATIHELQRVRNNLATEYPHPRI